MSISAFITLRTLCVRLPKAVALIWDDTGSTALARRIVLVSTRTPSPNKVLSTGYMDVSLHHREPAKRASRLERVVEHQLVSALQFVRRRFLEKRNPRPHHLFRDVERQ